MAVLAGVSAVLTGIGVIQALVASRSVAAFARRPRIAPADRPGITVLKPLHGDEPRLAEALATLCRQDYPQWQVVFGVQDSADPAIAVVEALRSRWPELDIALVVDPTPHGANRKIANLINMLPAARNDVLVIADSDIHVRPDYLDRLVSALWLPTVGLVTTLYAGLPTTADQTLPIVSRLGATQITHGFLPGAVLARTLGRQDCLGATMCLRRADLERIGGLQALAEHLADDNVLGRRIKALGLNVALADTVPLTTVSETRLSALFQHELRWARTIRALEPAGFAASVVQYPLAWSLLTILLAGGALWSIGLFLIAWVLRAVAALQVDSALLPLWRSSNPRYSHEHGSDDNAALAFSCPVWLLPVRDAFSVAVMLVSYGGRQVVWRGHGLHADTPPPSTQQPVKLRPIEGINTR